MCRCRLHIKGSREYCRKNYGCRKNIFLEPDKCSHFSTGTFNPYMKRRTNCCKAKSFVVNPEIFTLDLVCLTFASFTDGISQSRACNEIYRFRVPFRFVRLRRCRSFRAIRAAAIQFVTFALSGGELLQPPVVTFDYLMLTKALMMHSYVEDCGTRGRFSARSLHSTLFERNGRAKLPEENWKEQNRRGCESISISRGKA